MQERNELTENLLEFTTRENPLGLSSPLIVGPLLHTMEHIQHFHVSPQARIGTVLQARLLEHSLHAEGYHITLPKDPLAILDPKILKWVAKGIHGLEMGLEAFHDYQHTENAPATVWERIAAAAAGTLASTYAGIKLGNHYLHEMPIIKQYPRASKLVGQFAKNTITATIGSTLMFAENFFSARENSSPLKATFASAMGTGAGMVTGTAGLASIGAGIVAFSNPITATFTIGAGLLLGYKSHDVAKEVTELTTRGLNSLSTQYDHFMMQRMREIERFRRMARVSIPKKMPTAKFFSSLTPQSLQSLGQIVVSNTAAVDKAIDNHLNIHLGKLFKNPSHVVTTKHHLENLSHLKEFLVNPKKPLIHPSSSNKNGFNKLTEASKLILAGQESLQFMGELGRITGNDTLQKIGIAGTSLIQIGTAIPQMLGALSGAAPALALNPAGAILLGAITIYSLFAKSKSKSDPLQCMMQQMTQAVIAEIHELRNEFRAEFNQVHQELKLVFNEIQSLTHLVLQGFNQLDQSIHQARVEISHLHQDMRIGHEEIIARVADVQRRIESCQHLILGALQDQEMKKLSSSLNDVPRLLASGYIESKTDKKFAAQQLKKTNQTLLSNIQSKGHLTRALVTGQNLVDYQVPIHVNVNDDKVLAKLDASEQSATLLASRMGYLAPIAARIMSELNEQDGKEQYFSAVLVKHEIRHFIENIASLNIVISYLENPFALVNVNAIVNPLIWSQVTYCYNQFRNSFANIIDDKQFFDLESIMSVGREQLQLIEKFQNTPALFEILFNAYQDTLNKIIQLEKQAFENQNQKLFKEMLGRFPNKADIYKPKRPIDITKDIKFAIDEFIGVRPGNSFIRGNSYTYFINNPHSWEGELISQNGTPTPSSHEDLIPNFGAQFPANLTLADHLGLGKFSASYDYIHHGLSSTDIDYTIAICWEGNHVLTIRLSRRNGTMTRHLEKTAGFDSWEKDAINKLKNKFVSERKEANASLIDHKHTNTFQDNLSKLSAYRALLIAYGHIIGLSNQNLQLLQNNLWPGEVVFNQYNVYRSTADYDSQPPSANLVPNFQITKMQVLTAIRTPANLSSAQTVRVTSALYGLNFIKQKEMLEQDIEKQAQLAKSDLEFKSLLTACNETYDLLDPWIQIGFANLPEKAKKHKIYQTCEKDIRKIVSDLSSINEELKTQVSISAKHKSLLKDVKDRLKKLHLAFTTLSVYVKSDDKYKITNEQFDLLLTSEHENENDIPDLKYESKLQDQDHKQEMQKSESASVSDLKKPQQQLVPQNTIADGNCAFHAIGEWNGKNYQERFIHTKRHHVANAVKEAKPNSEIYQLALNNIEALLMGRDNVSGIHIQKLQKDYQHYVNDNMAKMDQAWILLEKKITSYPDIVRYLDDAVTANDIATRNLQTFKAKFHFCLNKNGGVLRALILSVPELENAIQQYNIVTNADFNLARKLQGNPGILNDYADFLEKNGNHLLPNELKILALVFNITIKFYTVISPLKSNEPTYVGTFNPGHEIFHVSFNGVNHFERMNEEPKQQNQMLDAKVSSHSIFAASKLQDGILKPASPMMMFGAKFNS